MHNIVPIISFAIRLLSMACVIVGGSIFIHELPSHFNVYMHIISLSYIVILFGFIYYLTLYFGTKFARSSTFKSIRNTHGVNPDFLKGVVRKMRHPRYYIDLDTIMFTANIFIGYNMTGLTLAGTNLSLLILHLLQKINAKLFAEIFEYRLQNK